MRTKRKTVQVMGALIFAAFALFAVGCTKQLDSTTSPIEGSSQFR